MPKIWYVEGDDGLFLLHDIRLIFSLIQASLRLATSQNKLLFAESIIILSTVFLTIGAFFGGLFGMNLKNHYEESDWAFGYVVAISILFIMIGTYSVCYYFRGNGTYPKIFDAAYFNFGCWNIED